jgi:putative membrane protein
MVAKTFCCSLVLVSANCIAQVAAVPAAPSLPVDFGKHSDKFIVEAANRGTAEIEMGKVALQKSKDGNINELATAIVKDRTAANDELKRVAAKSRLTMPTGRDSQREAVTSALQGKAGREFDTAYAQQVATDYNETIHLFQEEARSPDADLASFAKDTLPVLNRHLQMAQRLARTGPGVKLS